MKSWKIRSQFDRNLTLENLEGENWGEPSPQDTNLVKKCMGLRRVPINQFSVEDLRLMLGQQIGILYLVPVALELLRSNPLAEGKNYPGDLLGSVLLIKPEFWKDNPQSKKEIGLIVEKAQEMLTLPQQHAFISKTVLEEDYEKFKFAVEN